MSGIPLDKALLLALFLENITYGIFLTLFILLVTISYGEKEVRLAKQRFLLPVATLMMVIATTHLVIDFVRVLQAFVTGNKDEPPNPIGYYEELYHPLHVGKTPIYVVQTFLGDSVLVWRCYVIYNRKLFILIPGTMIWLVNLAVGMVVSWSISLAVPGQNIFHIATQWIAAFFILTMGLNLSCTVAIAAKIWATHRSATSASSRSLFPVMAAIIESGAIYTSSVLGLLVAYLAGSNGAYSALDFITPLVGVVYCLIVLQIHFHMRVSNVSIGETISTWLAPQARRHDSPQTELTPNDIELKPYALQGVVAVHITSHAETHTHPELQSKAHVSGVV